MLGIAYRQYARQWAGNSTFYEAQGIYNDLAAHLALQANPRRVLDLGCGRGEGLDALRTRLSRANTQIVGLDQNVDCLAATANRFGLHSPKSRLKWIQAIGRDYDLAYISNSLPLMSELTLINSDYTRPDLELETFLNSNGPFDAVTLWFPGTHGAQSYDVVAKADGLKSSAMVRMAAETHAGFIAKELAHPGGVLHIANRGQSRSETACRATLEPIAEKFAKLNGLSLQSFAIYPYKEPVNGDNISVCSVEGSNFGAKTFVTSAIFKID